MILRIRDSYTCFASKIQLNLPDFQESTLARFLAAIEALVGRPRFLEEPPGALIRCADGEPICKHTYSNTFCKYVISTKKEVHSVIKYQNELTVLCIKDESTS